MRVFEIIVEEMAAFDRLPEPIRKAMNDAPAPYEVATMHKFLDKGFSVEQLLAQIEQWNLRVLAAIREERFKLDG